ncbi:myc-associated zinc finger protein-like [Denticeps clupeoides]|uniref:myc-associated zinc finger protein-like n=1 Tax=Denticeps clupeoides TaxID=299321 RepID=UPI0010A33860|nr:myc-associated zinc finger protein-like [Denticeps clupeoides]
MDTVWTNFLFQTTPTQTSTETTLQSDLLPDLAGASEAPPAEHIATPPSTVDTAALSEEPGPAFTVPTEKSVPRPARPAHICSICNKTFKNSYNLRRHQSVHTGIRMKPREKDDGGKAPGRVERQTIPLSLLQLSVPSSLAAGPGDAPQQPPLGTQQVETVAVSITTATVTMATPQALNATVVVAGSLVQHLTGSNAVLAQAAQNASLNLNLNSNPAPTANPNPVRKNHACEACGKAFRDVYHLNRHRLSHSDEKPYCCPICQQRFKRKDRMSYHVRSHQGGIEKPYVCPHCAKGFSRCPHRHAHARCQRWPVIRRSPVRIPTRRGATEQKHRPRTLLPGRLSWPPTAH